MDERKPIKDIRVSDLLGDVKRDKAVAVDEAAPLRDVISAMIDDNPTRKVYVVGKDGKLVGTITLETLLRYAGYTIGVRGTGITSFFKMLGEIGDEKASQAMTGAVKVTMDELVVNAAKLMVDNHLNDLPVIDHEGRLIAELNGAEILRYARESW